MSLTRRPKQDIVLPPLRGDLRLITGASAADGSPTWVIVDPIRGKYFQIGWDAYQILSRWASQSAEAVLAQIHTETTCRASIQDVEEPPSFFLRQPLMRDPPQGGYRAYAEQAEAARPSWVTWLIHHYLFFQIPLLRRIGSCVRRFRL